MSIELENQITLLKEQLNYKNEYIKHLEDQLLKSNSIIKEYKRKYENLNIDADNEERPDKKRQKIRKTIGTERILQLKENPTSIYEIKSQGLLDMLIKENEELIEYIDNNNSSENMVQIPKSSYDRVIDEKKQISLERDGFIKLNDRLKKQYKLKIGKFLDVIYKFLGYKIEFINENKVKFIPKLGNEDNHEEHAKRFISVDMGNGEMKLNKESFSVGDSNLDVDIDRLVKFWVVENGQLCCLLSALTLELFEKEKYANSSTK